MVEAMTARFACRAVSASAAAAFELRCHVLLLVSPEGLAVSVSRSPLFLRTRRFPEAGRRPASPSRRRARIVALRGGSKGRRTFYRDRIVGRPIFQSAYGPKISIETGNFRSIVFGIIDQVACDP